jgi:hypothetical protein
MEDRINKQGLLDILIQWNSFLKKKIHLIALPVKEGIEYGR